MSGAPTQKTDQEEPRRPAPRKPADVETVWLDIDTGAGVDMDGREVLPILGGRRTKKPILSDLLTTALHHHARRLVVCGQVPDHAEAWLLPTDSQREEFDGTWTTRGLYLRSGAPARGRFTHIATEAHVDLHVAGEWFGGHDLTPVQARWSTRELASIINQVVKREWALMDRPGAEGINLWKLLAPDSYDMAPMDPDIGALIASTSPQHRYEYLVKGPSSCDCGDCLAPIDPGTQIDRFAYIDGRFMYAGSVTGEVGAAPATMLEGDAAQDLFTENPYWPARYHIRFRIPSWWTGIGILPVKHPDGKRWHWPNRPGSVHETWADASELKLAVDQGYTTEAAPEGPVDNPVEFLGGIKLSKVNSLRPYAEAVQRMIAEARHRWADKNPTASGILEAALKHMYRVSIGQMASHNPVTTTTVLDSGDIPRDIASFTTLRDAKGHKIAYQYETERWHRDPDTWHPEIASRLWALSRVRTLSTPVAGTRLKTGALSIPEEQLIAIHGDAIYTSQVPVWSLPVEAGGGDDGRDGRLRLKGVLPGPLTVPATRADRGDLSEQAEAHGIPTPETDDA